MKILMVCLGNICRSPLAEGLLQDKVERLGLDVTVDSAGTASYHAGEHPDSRMIKTTASHGIDISQQRAQQFDSGHFEEFDRIYAMDKSNFQDILCLANSDDDRNKVDFLLNASHPGENRSVPDPWYGGEQGFEDVFHLVDTACEKIANALIDA
ncbi:MAG TPA: low molecular weight phosphotyrosine protein phosphatase [Flavobacteriales bacterium]|nr:low molecular weight phosphotyrosine protein phosphatase [Flavobacteriales bacterium]